MSEKILIIDDDLDTLRLVGLMLQRQGYQISAATNGQQGLEKAFDEDPDLILLDVMMPDMDGYEVTRRLRQNNLAGPAGYVSMEDGAVGGFVQRGVAAAGGERAVVEMGGSGTATQNTRATEASVRGFWKAYRRHMGY